MCQVYYSQQKTLSDIICTDCGHDASHHYFEPDQSCWYCHCNNTPYEVLLLYIQKLESFQQKDGEK